MKCTGCDGFGKWFNPKKTASIICTVCAGVGSIGEKIINNKVFKRLFVLLVK